MTEATATIQNRDGIHCRPSVLIVKEFESYPGQILVRSGASESDLRTVMSLMTLGLRTGDRVRIRVTGPDEEATARRVVELFETHFDFPPMPDGSTLPAKAPRVRCKAKGSRGEQPDTSGRNRA